MADRGKRNTVVIYYGVFSLGKYRKTLDNIPETVYN